MRLSLLAVLLCASLFAHAQCEISNLTVATGACQSNTTYAVTINFQVQNSTNDSFDVWANNGVLLGTYALNARPLTIPNFPYDGGANDLVKVCIDDNLNCCRIKEFPVPACINTPPNCEIFDLSVAPGACNGDSTYVVMITFQVQGATNASFGVWANNQFIGSFPLTALPLTIQQFPYNGGANDVVKVCINDNPNCCKTIEFPVPACITNPPVNCEIFNLTVATGACNGDSTYVATVNFQVQGTTNASFDIWANNQYVGFYPLTALPLTIQNFPYNGGTNDVVKVCINDNPNCCKIKEFPVPSCITNPPANCEIFNLTVATGACNGDSTYVATINFQVQGTTNASFDLWANNQYIGYYPLTALPLTIQQFPYNGGANDVVKVCINDNPNCCKIKEFPVPACINTPVNCDIFDLLVITGDCTGDSSYAATIKFQTTNPGNAQFKLWVNNQFLGSFPLSALPLNISNMPYNGGINDVVKVCIVDMPDCCETKEFPVPSCLFNPDCNISDLQVLTTGCLCGQFFAVLTFNHTGGGAQGFDIAGNGTSYGNYAYTQPQPIILGPLAGDETTNYEFVVRDHLITGCKDVYELGKIECPDSPTFQAPGVKAQLFLAPNPVTDGLSVSASIAGGVINGYGTVTILNAEGRTVRTLTVSNAAAFSLKLGDLPAGTYQLVLDTELGRLNGLFSKM
jgi:hypothetical protein